MLISKLRDVETTYNSYKKRKELYQHFAEAEEISVNVPWGFGSRDIDEIGLPLDSSLRAGLLAYIQKGLDEIEKELKELGVEIDE
jgi:hypothetical protein